MQHATVQLVPDTATYSQLRPRTVPAVVSVRRARALAARGHSAAAIASAAPGLDTSRVQSLLLGNPTRIALADHRRVTVAHQQLIDQAPAAPTFGDVDDPDTDDAEELVLDPDPLRVRQAIAGQLWARDLTSAETDAAVIGLRDLGKGREDIAGWLGITITDLETVETRISRAALHTAVGELRAAGHTPEQSSVILEVALDTVTRVYRRYDAAELDAAVIAGHEAGISHGTTAAALARTVKDVVLAWKNLYPVEFDQRVADLRTRGLTIPQVAAELGCGTTTIDAAYKRLNKAARATKAAS